MTEWRRASICLITRTPPPLTNREEQINIDGAPNGRYYIELPDGYRLIYDNSGYVGRYDPSMEEPI